jgi:hypothetical protein
MFACVIVVGQNPESQLRRFMCGVAPRGKGRFDFYNPGGRWSGMLPRRSSEGGVEPADVEREAREGFAIWRQMFEEHGRPKSPSELLCESGAERERYGQYPTAVWDAFHAQGAMEAWNEKYPDSIYSPIATFGFDEEAFVRRQVLSVASPLALVIDGKWMQCKPEALLDQNDLSWNLWVRDKLQSLPADALLSVFEYHF